MSEYDAGTPRQQSEYEEKLVTDFIKEFGQLNLWRSTTAAHWEEIAELIDPAARNTFYYNSYNWPGAKKTDRQVDATGMVALGRFAAIVDSLLTPRNQLWHALASDDPDIMKDRQARLWYEQATRILFAERYDAVANFTSQNQQCYLSLGAYGTCGMFIDQAVDDWNKPVNKLRYKNIPVGELFIRENHQGRVDRVFRWFKLTARQAYQKFGEDIPPVLKSALDQQSETLFDFLHVCCPRADYDQSRLDAKGKPYGSYYISIQGRSLLSEGGYYTFPYAVGRYMQTPMETYGRSPAMMVLPALKTLNAEKATFLKVGHRVADPVLLTFDDGLVDPTLKPGAVNKGGVNADGKPMIIPMEVGNIQTTLEMMQEEKALINDVNLVSLFQIMVEKNNMTATEVIERVNEKGILIAPTVGRQQSEYLGPMIHRELDLLIKMRKLPPLPPVLQRGRAEYNVVYTSPLARSQRAQDAAGLMRTVENIIPTVNVTGDPSPFDAFNFDKAYRDIAIIQGVPESWLNDDETIARKRQARNQAQQQQLEVQSLPAKAAMIKAQAAVNKNSGGVPGQPQPAQPLGQAA